MAPCSRCRRGRTTSLCAARSPPRSRPRTSGEIEVQLRACRGRFVRGVYMQVVSMCMCLGKPSFLGALQERLPSSAEHRGTVGGFAVCSGRHCDCRC